VKLIAALCLGGALCFAAPAIAGSVRATYDGSWALNFVAQRGGCNSNYRFNVTIANGVVTHPNLVRFKGKVNAAGFVRASVAVQGKFASGTGKLTGSSGRGTWTGRESNSECSGYWTAQRL
jgi:hypothetical protein